MTPSNRLTPGESPDPVDREEIARNVYRGALWELARIGKPVPAVLLGVLLALMLVFAIAGQPWPSIIVSAILIAVVVWSQRSVHRWVDEHNARVGRPAAPAKGGPAEGTRGAAVSKSKPKRAKPVRNRRRP